MKLSKLDKKIINVLLNNSRLSYRQIAEIVNVSPATVIKHIDTLKEEGIIRRYTTDISFYKLGY